MTAAPARSTWRDAAALAALHACRTQDDLEQLFAAGLHDMIPDGCAALCLADDDGNGLRVRFTLGERCPLAVLDKVSAGDWPLPDEQRLVVRYGHHHLGELMLAAPVDEAIRPFVEDALTHFGTALVNLALNMEARAATDDYCSTLQALEEGIVLFQETDQEAVMARLLALAAGMVQATAGALYVLDEVGNADSPMQLQQAWGMPETMLATFCSEDGSAWPDSLLAGPVQVLARSAGGSIAGLAADCVPEVLREVVVLPLRYHGVQAGVCVLFNPLVAGADAPSHISRLQSFGQLAAALLHRLNLERIRENNVSIQRELEIAETIQKRLVPTSAPPCADYEFAWYSLSAKSIGGDYVDLTMSDRGDVHAIIADASGHGINSALLMTSFRATYRGKAAWLQPSELAASLNEEVAHEVGPTGMFITCALVRIEQGSRRLSVCSAGHNPVMLFRAATGVIEHIDSHGPPMGFLRGAEFGSDATQLASGDVLLLYTDGVTEAADAQHEMFGEQRLAALLRQFAGGTAQSVLDAVLARLSAFTGGDQNEDDVSLMVIKAR